MSKSSINLNTITAPVLLDQKHQRIGFNCGEAALDEWLVKRAIKNQQNGASRTFVICDNNQVVGYYALAMGSVERITAPKSLARNMPEAIPVIVLARLAIDQQYQGRHLGAALLKDAMLRSLNVSQNVGTKALLVHAISEAAQNFYLSYSFVPSSIDPMTLLLPMTHIQRAFMD